MKAQKSSPFTEPPLQAAGGAGRSFNSSSKMTPCPSIFFFLMKCKEKEQSWMSLKASGKPGEERKIKLWSNPVLLEGRVSVFIIHYKYVSWVLRVPFFVKLLNM